MTVTAVYEDVYKRQVVASTTVKFTANQIANVTANQTCLLYTSKRENETVLYNILRKNNVAVIFGIDKSAQTFLNEQYPEARFYSQSRCV